MLGFKKIISSLASDKYLVTKYRSGRTDLSVIFTEIEDPIAKCSILIVTEPEDDEGYVHALEHLIFNGSQDSPHRGVLKKLDDDSTGWTEMDHTVFKFSATGQSNVLAALPIFLDHVMFPLLSEEDYILDVHHIDGEGYDGGLVYEEMKDAYCVPYKRLLSKLMKEMYPDSAYSYDYCGSESALRLSTSHAKLKDFHKKYYRPENMTVFVTGDINHDDTLKILAEFEDKIIAKRTSEPAKEWVKPWQTVPSSPNYGEYNSFHSVNYPDHDGHEKDAYMIFGWRGPVLSDATALKELAACEILLDYVVNNFKSAALHSSFDTEKPLIGRISSNVDPNKISQLRLELFNVPLDNMERAKCYTLEYLKNIRTGVISLNMDEIEKSLEDELNNDSNKDSQQLHEDIRLMYLFSLYLETDEFAAAMNPQWNLKQLSNETVDYWLNTFRKYFTDDVVIVNGIPIGLENEENKEKQRIDKQKKALGEDGLAEKARILEKAKMYREVSQLCN